MPPVRTAGGPPIVGPEDVEEAAGADLLLAEMQHQARDLLLVSKTARLRDAVLIRQDVVQVDGGQAID